MTDAVLIALIVAIPPTIVAIGGLIVSLLNRKQGQSIELRVNGKMDEMMQLVRDKAHAEGISKGRDISEIERANRVAEAERIEDRAKLNNSSHT